MRITFHRFAKCLAVAGCVGFQQSLKQPNPVILVGLLRKVILAARLLVRALQGQTEKSDQVFGWTR